MQVTVNGDPVVLDKPLNIADFLIAVKAEQPDYVSVQKNGDFVQRSDFNSVFVDEGDVIEFLYFMGGGCLA